MARHDIVRQTLLSLESVKLGRFVTNLSDPHEDYWDPPCDLTPKVIETSQSGYADTQLKTDSSSFSSEFTSTASASRSKQKLRLATIKTSQSTVFQLDNSGPWFTAAVKNEQTRHWMEEVIGIGEKIYMIVGYQTMVDASSLGASTKSVGLQARLQLPVSEAASAAGAMVVVGQIADPGFEVQAQSDQGSRRHFTAPGEQVYAVQYRMLRFKWYSSRNLDRARLGSGSWWTVDSSERSLRGQENGVNDVVEAIISDDDEYDDEEAVPSN